MQCLRIDSIKVDSTRVVVVEMVDLSRSEDSTRCIKIERKIAQHLANAPPYHNWHCPSGSFRVLVCQLGKDGSVTFSLHK